MHPPTKQVMVHVFSRAKGPFNIDNTLGFCPLDSSSLRSLWEARQGRFRSRSSNHTPAAAGGGGGGGEDVIGTVQMWCGASDAYEAWAALPAVAEALHVQQGLGDTNKQNYTACVLYSSFSRRVELCVEFCCADIIIRDTGHDILDRKPGPVRVLREAVDDSQPNALLCHL